MRDLVEFGAGSASYLPIQTKYLGKDQNEDHGYEYSLFVDVCTNALFEVSILEEIMSVPRTESPTRPIA